MRVKLIGATLVLLGIGATFPAAAPPSLPTITALRAASAVDVTRGTVIHDAVVIIQGDRIKAVGTGLAIPAGARRIDLGATTLLPGLIDAHTHLLDNRHGGNVDGKSAMLLGVAQMSTAKRALLGAAMGREALLAGFTTVRDLGNSGVHGDVALRDAIEAGWVTGPRIIAATRALAPAGGQFGALSREAQSIVDQEYAVISGVEEARRAARQAFYDGADCLKVIVNSGSRLLSVDEVKVIVDEAHRVGKKVAAHASTDQATRIAVEAGVDSIEHAYTISDDTLRTMAEKRIFLVPTDAPLEAYIEMYFNGRHPTPEERASIETLAKPGLEESRKRLARAVKIGVPIAAGSDIYIIWPGKTRGEASLGMFRAYAESGMPSLEILRAATLNNASLLGRLSDFGSLEAGKLADIIGVAGDPLKSVTALEQVRFVMKNGEIVRNDTGTP
jgi:imidazolonepropionase-like amidohydrolase